MSDTPEGKEFAGFPPPTKNFFSLPNEMINIIAHITNLAELKVIIYVIRHTWGFREYGIKKAITTDEFMHGRKHTDGTRMDEGTGLSNRSVIDGLRAAVKHGYLEDELDEIDKARKVKSYALKMQTSQIDESDVKNLHIRLINGCEGSSHRTDEIDVKNLHDDVKNLHIHCEEPSYRTEKDTIERHLEKKSVSEPPTESSPTQSTHTPFPDNQFARAMTIGDSPQSNDMRDVGVPSDNTEKPQPPHPRKNHINYDVPEEILVRARTLRSKWIEAYGPYGDAKWDNDALIWIAQQDNGTFENVQKVCEQWESVKPGEPVHPEQVKNKWFWANDKKKASSPKSISGRRRIGETDPAYAEYMAMIKEGGK